MTISRPVSGGRALWTWGLVAQASSSASSVVLTVVAGRLLGPSGLGVVVAGFAAYLLVLNVHRALVVTPLVATSSASPSEIRERETRAALVATLTVAATAASLFAAGGLALGGALGRGMLVFAPWLVPALVQDLTRSALFRDGRGRLAAGSDLAWLVIFVSALPMANEVRHAWAVVASWGLGAVGAAGLALVPTGYRHARSIRAWFRRRAFPFGRWLVLQESAYQGGSYALVAALTVILGSSGVGGLRAAETVFAPFSLLSRAAALPGLPAVTRALGRSHAEAVRLAAAISLGVVTLTLAYLVLMIATGGSVLALLFGEEFTRFRTLLVPLSVWQVALAATLGFGILLTAQRRGRALLASSIAGISSTLGASSVLASMAGVEGAAWGLAIGTTLGGACAIGLAIRPAGTEGRSQGEAEERRATTSVV